MFVLLFLPINPQFRLQLLIDTNLSLFALLKAYYSGEVNVLVSENYSRAASGGVDLQKSGNYAASFYPAQLALKEGYQQIIRQMPVRINT